MVDVTHCICNVWYTGDAVCRFIYKANDRIVETVATDLNEKKDNNNKYSKSYRLTLSHTHDIIHQTADIVLIKRIFLHLWNVVVCEPNIFMRCNSPKKSIHTEREQMKQKHSRKKHNIK